MREKKSVSKRFRVYDKITEQRHEPIVTFNLAPPQMKAKKLEVVNQAIRNARIQELEEEKNFDESHTYTDEERSAIRKDDFKWPLLTIKLKGGRSILCESWPRLTLRSRPFPCKNMQFLRNSKRWRIKTVWGDGLEMRNNKMYKMML